MDFYQILQSVIIKLMYRRQQYITSLILIFLNNFRLFVFHEIHKLWKIVIIIVFVWLCVLQNVKICLLKFPNCKITMGLFIERKLWARMHLLVWTWICWSFVLTMYLMLSMQINISSLFRNMQSKPSIYYLV